MIGREDDTVLVVVQTGAWAFSGQIMRFNGLKPRREATCEFLICGYTDA